VSLAVSTKSDPRVQELCCEVSPPGPGEILVRVQACGLSHVDHALSTGAVSQLRAHRAPYACAMDAAATVIATGDRVTRFAVGDELFGHFPAASWAWVQAPCARTTADGPHVEHRPEGLDPLAAVALAQSGLTATTIMRAAELRPGQTVLVFGATSRAGTLLVPILTVAGAHVIADATPEDDDYVRSLGAADTIQNTTATTVADALASHPDVELLIDLVSFGEPYFITAAASHGTIVTAVRGADEPCIPRIEISAKPGDLAALVQRALDRRQTVETSHVRRLEKIGQPRPGNRDPAARPALVGGDGRQGTRAARLLPEGHARGRQAGRLPVRLRRREAADGPEDDGT
jgi:NADPH2:quinone reductase